MSSISVIHFISIIGTIMAVSDTIMAVSDIMIVVVV